MCRYRCHFVYFLFQLTNKLEILKYFEYTHELTGYFERMRETRFCEAGSYINVTILEPRFLLPRFEVASFDQTRYNFPNESNYIYQIF